MINKLKEYVKKNATILFKTDGKNNLEAIFDKKGFWFHSITQSIYDRIKSKPHLYIAFTKDGYMYIGISNQQGGRWKRQHAYHLGTLAYHLLGTIRYDDQNHLHWIDAWMDTKSLKLNNKLNTIALKETVHISFIPFELYSGFNNIHPISELHTKKTIKNINEAVELALIKSYQVDGYKLLNVKKTSNNKLKTKSSINRTPPPKTPIIEIGSQYAGRNHNCVEFEITNNDNIAIIAAIIPNLPDGRCTIEITNKANGEMLGIIRTIRTPGRTVSQYFNAQNTNNNNIQKWLELQNKMNIPGAIIPLAIVKVCPIL